MSEIYIFKEENCVFVFLAEGPELGFTIRYNQCIVYTASSDPGGLIPDPELAVKKNPDQYKISLNICLRVNPTEKKQIRPSKNVRIRIGNADLYCILSDPQRTSGTVTLIYTV